MANDLVTKFCITKILYQRLEAIYLNNRKVLDLFNFHFSIAKLDVDDQIKSLEKAKDLQYNSYDRDLLLHNIFHIHQVYILIGYRCSSAVDKVQFITFRLHNIHSDDIAT